MYNVLYFLPLRQHWQSIRGHYVHRPHRIQDRLNLLYPVKREELLDKLYKATDSSFKLQASFGYILQHKETDEQKYFHPSQNNAAVFDKAPLVRNFRDLEKAVDVIMNFDPHRWAQINRPDTKWFVLVVCQVSLYINRLKDHPIGRQRCGHSTPRFIAKNKGLDNLTTNLRGDDNLCLFRCLAKHMGKDDDKAAYLCRKAGFNPFLFKGLGLDELYIVERKFSIQIWVYQLELTDDDGEEAITGKLIRRSPFTFPDKLYLNLYDSHFSRITDLARYCSKFPCNKCGHVFTKQFNAQRHERLCRQDIVEVFPGGIYKPKPSIIDQLKAVGIEIPSELTVFPYRAVFDIEVFFQNPGKEVKNSPSTVWECVHVPASIGVTSNVSGFKHPKCFVSDGNSQMLVNNFVDYLNDISEKSYTKMKSKLSLYIEQLDEKIETEKKRCDLLELEQGDEWDETETRLLKHLEKLKLNLNTWMKKLVVLGFNSGKYDINVLLPFLVERCKSQGIHIRPVKRNSSFITLSTDQLQFLDLSNYLAPNTSYAQYLKTFNPKGDMKAFFPYQWFDSLAKLNETSLPPHEAFYSSLKACNISEEEYASCLVAWREKNMKTFRDYLEYYQLLDTQPMLEAVKNQCKFFIERGIDMFKDACSLPGISSKYVFKNSPNAKFMLFSNSDADIFKSLKHQFTGGPPIIFHREAHSGESKIKERQYGDDAHTVENIVGYDANSLYLSCTGKSMPLGYMTRRKAPNFTPTKPARAKLAVEWLEYMNHVSEFEIKHELNNWPEGEKKVGGKMLSVDGYHEDESGHCHVYEMHGCLYHAHSCLVGKGKKYKWEDLHPIQSDRTWREVASHSQSKDSYIKSLPNTTLNVMYECQWNFMKKTYPKINKFVETCEYFKKNSKWPKNVSEEDILQMVLKKELFGIVWCDIRVPDELKSKFAEFPPIFKNAEVSRADIGSFMRAYCEKENLLTSPRKLLISSYFGKAQLIPTDLLRWYLKHGLIVDRIYEVLEFQGGKCFLDFVEMVTTYRRAGDGNQNLAILSELFKLFGNSFYGKTLEDKAKQKTVSYCNDPETCVKIRDKRFVNLNEVGDKYYEVQLTKQRIHYDLPILVGFFVYANAKKRLLEFHYDCIAKHTDSSMRQEMSTDTDSMYYALSKPSLSDIVLPSKRKVFFKKFRKYFPSPACDDHYDAFVENMTSHGRWVQKECCKEREKFDQRTPALFKIEAEGVSMVCLNSKTYFLLKKDDQFKLSSKGLSKTQNKFTLQDFVSVLKTKESKGGKNIGFRTGRGKKMFTYVQERKGFSYLYIKRKVLSDGISTIPLNL